MVRRDGDEGGQVSTPVLNGGRNKNGVFCNYFWNWIEINTIWSNATAIQQLGMFEEAAWGRPVKKLVQ